MNHHELIIKLSTVIRCSYSSLPGIHPLHLSPEMSEIYGTMDDEKLQIHNEVYKCPGLRKIHLETAKLGSLDVLHCVFFPDSNYDLPIFGADVVATPRGVGAAIVDLSPVGDFSPTLNEKLKRISTSFNFKEERKLPEWGSIFSPHCKFIRPINKVEESQFINAVESFLEIYTLAVMDAKPTEGAEERLRAQLHYCNQQKKNDKTRGILERCFSKEWTDRYMDEVLFDEPK